MKRLFAVLISVLLCLSLILCVSASEEPGRRLVDNADILDSEEEARLNSKLDRISEDRNFDVVILTTLDLDGQEDILEYAEDFYEAGGYGKNGIILVRKAGDSPQYGYLTLGKGNKIFDDDAFDTLDIRIVHLLSEGEPLEAFHAFADTCDEILEAFVPPYVLWIVISLIVGILLAFFIPMKILKGQLKSVRMHQEATNYVRPNSMNMTNSRDIFLYRTITRTEKPKDNSSSSGGSSSTRTTSSGNRGRSGSC